MVVTTASNKNALVNILNISLTFFIFILYHSFLHRVHSCKYLGMARVFDCGFSRAAVKEAYYVHQSGDAASMPARRKSHFDSQFSDCGASFVMDQLSFTRRSQALVAKLRSWRNISKNQYFDEFSMDKWRKLPISERQLHNLENCVQCETMSSKQQTLFDAACLKSKRKGKALRDITNTSTPKQSKKSTGTTSSDLQIPPEAV